MKPILVKERKSGQIFEEQVFGGFAVRLLYGKEKSFLRALISKNRFVSAFYGWWQKRSWSRHSIKTFIEKYGVNKEEFEKQEFSSFNDFFTRRLKEEARPIAYGDKVAVMPADARYHFFPTIDQETFYQVKNTKLTLEQLVQDKELAQQYVGGSMVIARLCPTDYHRFHFPVEGKASAARFIEGPLYSVNPWALLTKPSILIENKRAITEIDSPYFGKVLYIEIGATCVGTIVETYEKDKIVAKGQEKGYFSFGGSCIILLFQKGKIAFDEDLLNASHEIHCLMGESLGKAL